MPVAAPTKTVEGRRIRPAVSPGLDAAAAAEAAFRCSAARSASNALRAPGSPMSSQAALIAAIRLAASAVSARSGWYLRASRR